MIISKNQSTDWDVLRRSLYWEVMVVHVYCNKYQWKLKEALQWITTSCRLGMPLFLPLNKTRAGHTPATQQDAGPISTRWPAGMAMTHLEKGMLDGKRWENETHRDASELWDRMLSDAEGRWVNIVKRWGPVTDRLVWFGVPSVVSE